jgi:hypothetical protein
MRDRFLRLCSDDPVCAVQLPAWKKRLASWTYPSDSGTCVTWMKQIVIDIDADHPMPGKYTDSGNPKTWPELMVGGVMLPAKEAAAPLKTFVQSFCHDEQDCGTAGNWQGTVSAVDGSLQKQSNLTAAMVAKPPTPVVKLPPKQ